MKKLFLKTIALILTLSFAMSFAVIGMATAGSGTVEKPGFAPVTAEVTVTGGVGSAPALTMYLWGDVNGDGRVNSGDATLILRRAVNAITSFPVEAK